MTTTLDTFSDSILVSRNLRGPAQRFRSESINLAGNNLLADIHAEIGDWKWNEAAALREYNAEKRAEMEAGVTSEINSKVDGFTVGETLERVEVLFERHPFGFKPITPEDREEWETDEEAELTMKHGAVLGMKLARQNERERKRLARQAVAV